MHNSITVRRTKQDFLDHANSILNGLREREFKKIKKPVWLTWLPRNAGPFWNKLFADPEVGAFWFSPRLVLKEAGLKIDSSEHRRHLKTLSDLEIIIFNPKAKYLLSATDAQITELLRHELLHIEMQKGHDAEFLNTALKRDIIVQTRDILNQIDDVDLNLAIHFLEDQDSG